MSFLGGVLLEGCVGFDRLFVRARMNFLGVDSTIGAQFVSHFPSPCAMAEK